MSAPTYLVIACKPDNTQIILPADLKPVPKKEAQRLATAAVHVNGCKQARVVEEVMIVNA